ncbi:MAG: hypothetical protein IJV07_04025 [Alphaproteobacteria bacterium]|nr:hypothetical protein [Alphaproteobacteria bacterium]
MSEKYNVICIKWGVAYSAADVNKLCSMVKRNTSFDIDFYCFTENADGLNNDIIVRPLPVLNVPPEENKYAYKKEAGLCDDNLGGLNGQRVFFFDLDSLIVGNLDEFFRYPKGDKFYIINDWNTKGDTVGQASCYSWVVGTLGYVKKYFEDHPREVTDKYYTASQEYLSAKVIEKEGHLNFWPDNWFCSFRFHCLPKWPFRFWKMAKIPDRPGLKMIAFHGLPGLEDARQGIWCIDKTCPKYPRGIKKLYKYVRPVTWINDYWK